MGNSKVIIIGAGIAGIATAIRLRKQGFEVLVLESAATYGGKIKDYKWLDYRFDTGPSLFTLPELVDELFQLCGKDPRSYFNYDKLPVVTKYFYGDKTVINAYANPSDFAQEVEKKTGVEKAVVNSFLEIQKETYGKLAHLFLENPIHIFSRLLKVANLPALLHLMQFRFLRTMNGVNKSWFRNDALVKLFNRYGTYNGSNPYVMPSLFNIISHLEHNTGAFFPEGGMSTIAHVLYKLAQEEGVEFRFNSYVKKIVEDKGRVKGVISAGETIETAKVISNMDANLTYEHLLPEVKYPKHYLDNQKSTSALIFHWAMEGNYPDLEVHNILFAENYKEEFEFLFNKKQLYKDPTVYIYISSKAQASDAPSNGENWFVMINVPHLTPGADWEQLEEEGRAYVKKKIKDVLGIDVTPKILHEHVTTPKALQDTTHSYLGSLYGGSSNSMMSGFLRHPNFSKVKGLYFAGGTVHPGGGVPLCLLSAKITADLVREKYND